MHEENAARACSIHETARHHGRTGAFPILGIDRPEDRGIAEFTQHQFLLILLDRSARRPHRDRSDAAGFNDLIVGGPQFFEECLVGHAGKSAVGDGVIPDLVPLVDHALEQVGAVFHHVADHVEGRLDLARLQHVEEARRIFGMRPVVEGDRNDFLARLHPRVGVVDRTGPARSGRSLFFRRSGSPGGRLESGEERGQRHLQFPCRER